MGGSGGAPATTGGQPTSSGSGGHSGSAGAPGSAGTGPVVSGWQGFACPSGPFAASPVAAGAVAQRVQGVPPNDDFIMNAAQDLIIVEGPVWRGDALYLSEIENGSQFGGFGDFNPQSAPPPSRLLKVTSAGVSVAVPDAGTNGLALDPSGALVGCNHKSGAITLLDLNGGSGKDSVTTYMGSRFDSPNDLAFGPDGTLYFSDPDYQSPSPRPQTQTRVYSVAPGSSTATAVVEDLQQPNGLTFSPDGKTLYISSSGGVFAYPVLAGGKLGTRTAFGASSVRSSDGMGIDCAGNVYIAGGQSVVVLDPKGTVLSTISVPGVTATTNVAFGGADHRTLYITAQGSSSAAGLFTLPTQIPGLPY